MGIGQRGATPQINGQRPVRLDEVTLQTIALETGGSYFYAAEATELERVYTDLGSQIRWVKERTEITALVRALETLLVLLGSVLSLRWFQQFP